MALHVTQCPSCESTFNTSARMLEAAHGLVRCGACLSVFEANENYINSLPPASNDELEPGETDSVFISGQEDYFDPTSFLQRSELVESDEDLEAEEESWIGPDEKEVDVQQEEKDLQVEATGFETTESVNIEHSAVWTITDLSAEHKGADLEASFTYENVETEQQAEESFVELPDTDRGTEADDVNPIAQDSEITHPSPPRQSDPDQPETDLTTFLVPTSDESTFELENAAEETSGQSTPESEEEENATDDSDSALEDLAFVTNGEIGANTDVEETPDEFFVAIAYGMDTEDADEIEEIEEIEEIDDTSIDIVSELESVLENEALLEDDRLTKIESKDEIRARLESSALAEDDGELESLTEENLAAIESVDSSLELDQARPGRQLRRTVTFTLASLLLLLVLVGQFFWQRMPLLSLDPQLRPWYEMACGLINCELPPIQDLLNIQTENLVIRSHPDTPNSLELTAVFRNVASYQQPFPIIELSFTDLDSQPVVSREFLPSEYLPPALRAISNMPVGAPVQITLEFVDPGETAVNYALNYKPFPRPL